MTESYLIVGGSSDIAKIVAKNLLESGYCVTLLARDESRISDLEQLGAKPIVGDSLDEDVLVQAISTASELGGGKISGVAHLVGSIAIRPPHAMKLDAFQDVISTNLTSAFLTLSMTGKSMLKSGGGRMVFTSSVAGSLGLVNHEAIAAAKGGIEAMVRSAAATYAKRGIRVNAVAPGLTDTRLASSILRSEQMREASAAKIPINRINEAEEIAQAITWLLTSSPDNYTGQVMHLDGGMSQLAA
ncbi:MAG: SDR family oxidoreductase [Euryarchaeota archaeon]